MGGRPLSRPPDPACAPTENMSSVLMSAPVCWNYSHEINAFRDHAWLRINCSLLGWGAFIAIHAQIALIATAGLIHLTTRASVILGSSELTIGLAHTIRLIHVLLYGVNNFGTIGPT